VEERSPEAEHPRREFLNGVINEFLVDERGFEIELSEFRLAIGPQVFIPEARAI